MEKRLERSCSGNENNKNCTNSNGADPNRTKWEKKTDVKQSGKLAGCQHLYKAAKTIRCVEEEHFDCLRSERKNVKVKRFKGFEKTSEISERYGICSFKFHVKLLKSLQWVITLLPMTFRWEHERKVTYDKSHKEELWVVKLTKHNRRNQYSYEHTRCVYTNKPIYLSGGFNLTYCNTRLVKSYDGVQFITKWRAISCSLTWDVLTSLKV